ncbi:proto-oncogene tyrosine-protein kinase ROS-like isoform X2 [Physella acuta]|uniref:proto-oncogene tyrosine-protein kinase ROS-like isoform X2 n=1 Tax=Physella acuta TaxID=109671 RepID=UPI0027DD5150|nr:proto-oncogene tyrosine-protein kinase ROS-like isoform X2 [Physella acuta]
MPTFAPTLFLLLFVAVVVVVPVLAGETFSNDQREILGTCKGNCEQHLNALSDAGNTLFCDSTCSVEQCRTGCSHFKDAVQSSCPRVCTDSYRQNFTEADLPRQDLIRNCMQGCIFGLEIYYTRIKDQIGSLEKPLLEISTLNSTSLTLKWKAKILEDVSYKVMKRIIGIDSGWHEHLNATFRTDERIELQNLCPYVTYKFKVLVLLTSLPDHILYTTETAEITTQANGVPSTSPRITSLLAPAPRVISLTWSPPPFTNGKLLSYRIYVQPSNHSSLKPTTIEIPVNVTTWLLSQLQPSQSYTISVSAFNAEGEGPRDSQNITTPSLGNLSEHETPYLILGSGNKVIKKNLLEIKSDWEYCIGSINGTIKDIAVHVSQNLLLVSDSAGTVTLVNLTSETNRTNHYPSIPAPGAITLDWLSDRVYVASEDKIYSCPLFKDLCFVVIQGLVSTAVDIKVDPVNGFFYLIIVGQGLYRFNLSDLQGSHMTFRQPLSLDRAKFVLSVNDLYTYIIDISNVHLYVVNNGKMMSTFLDGSNKQVVREKIVASKFHNVTSMVIFNQTFIWTNQTKMFYEESKDPSKVYYHNELLCFGPPFAGINVFHPSAQPTPVPSSAPDNLEALFSMNRVVIRWNPPPLLQYQGSGAWSNWTYEVDILKKGEKTGRPYNVTQQELIVDNLQPNSEYSIRVRAKTQKTDGPWSQIFVGTTLLKDDLTVLLGIADGKILQNNLTDSSEKAIVNFLSKPIDIIWYNDIILWVTDKGNLSFYNQTSKQKRSVKDSITAFCTAYDWLGNKVYWSDPRQIAIYRSDLNGINIELVRRTAARDLAIDAIAGRLYWATMHSVESSYLNGDDHKELFTLPYFGGRNVVSLTLDDNSGKVYWYVKGYDMQSIYRTQLNVSAGVEKIGDFRSISSTSGLQYFSNRLFWLSEKNSLMVGDVNCNFSSTVSLKENITSFTIINRTTVKKDVIPNPIRSEDIRTQGESSRFNLTWSRSTGVNHGTIFYKIFIEHGNTRQATTTSKHWCEVLGLSPFTQLIVSIQPYTFWGYADPTKVTIRSPMSKPSAPGLPEVYIIRHKNNPSSQPALAADFRWATPTVTNGIISHHYVFYWMGKGIDPRPTNVTVNGTARNFVLTSLVKGQVYNFKVIACTEVGCGPESATKTVVIDALSPIPTLMVASKSSLSLLEMVGEFNSSNLLNDGRAQAITYLSQDDTSLFWLDKLNQLFMTTSLTDPKEKPLNCPGKKLTIDWISRTLYIIDSKLTSIKQYDIERNSCEDFLTRPGRISSIVVDPYSSTIFWTEITSTGETQINSANVISKEVSTVLGSNAYARNKTCNCSPSFKIAPTLAYARNEGQTELAFVDSAAGALYISDAAGCQCNKILQATYTNNFGFPPNLLAIDHLRVSWYNNSEGKLYSVNKISGQGLIKKELSDVLDIKTYGSHLQPLPDLQCLEPGAYNYTVQKVGDSWITLALFPLRRQEECRSISAPQDNYTISYRKVTAKSGGEYCQTDPNCLQKISLSKEITISDLDPYSEYLIQVAVSNYYKTYTPEEKDSIKVMTQFGIPSPARDVVAIVGTPEKITVKWLPPLRLNGPAENISYNVLFSTSINNVLLQKKTDSIFNTKTAEGMIETVLRGLEPGHRYQIQVHSCMVNESNCSTSETVEVSTFQTPHGLRFLNVTSHSLVVAWKSPPDDSISRHQIIYAEANTSPLEWIHRFGLPGITNNASDYFEEIDSLDPNTLYAFRIKATYKSRPFDGAVYVWPPEERQFVQKTLDFSPDRPFSPGIRQPKNGMYEVYWLKPDDNGSPILSYYLEIRNTETGNWSLVYNGTEQRWLVDTSDLDPGKAYIFRVAAMNSKGLGPYSDNSTTFLAPHAVISSQQITTGIAVGVVVFVLFLVLAVFIIVVRKRQDKIKTRQFIIRGPDTELATLRELPHTAFQQSNTLYAISIKCTDEEIAKLPHFSRNQLVLTMFLGSGAFGEVFEGLAKNILGDSTGETKCAVKTLRKSASDHEKEEFLKEALLMKNFQHENILRLLGVCLDNDPQFIIMELMEGGDLLSFLRYCRATATTPAKLMLPDLVKICVHVAKGCRYLEEMHFVHRDLAARNCLVSSKSPLDMVVKIGDFGLARDIYKNDYYRKEGEGLLPVRWMSPESLVDGFFTTQSDIWAFGVLMWEVVTLGQQPYPARTNIEVLHFVRDGGKLERPEKCADEMFALMRKCWCFSTDNRPSFAELLASLEEFQNKCLTMSPQEIAQLSPSVMDVNNDAVQLLEEETQSLLAPDSPNLSLFTPNSRVLTGGGSVRLTQTGKQKRLKDLLGSSDVPEKLVVDLTKIGRKRTHSLEAKNSFPAASDYDHNGYLEPRGAKGEGYLELINYAPELRHLLDSPVTPGSVHVTRKGYHPSNVSYTLLRPHEVGAYSTGEEVRGYSAGDEVRGYIPDDVSGSSDYRYAPPKEAFDNVYRLGSVQESPIYSRVCDDRRHYSTDSTSQYYPQPQENLQVRSQRQRKFSDQDLYFSTAPYRQSNSSNDHRYASVECNNNGSSRRQNSGGSNQQKPGFSHLAEENCHDLDDVFLDNDSYNSAEFIHPHQRHGSRSRGQVYPENCNPILGYENQVSLV